MCIRDRVKTAVMPFGFSGYISGSMLGLGRALGETMALLLICLLYTSDAADERSSVDLGGRRIIKTKHEGTTLHQLNLH